MAGKSEQPVIFEKIARGNGKIFALVRTPGYMREYGLRAKARTPEGTDVPALVLDSTIPGCCIIALAILDVPQICTLTCEGIVVARKTFRPRLSQLESGLRTRINDAQAQLMRNWDGQSHRVGCRVGISRVMRAWRPGQIVQGDIRVEGLERQALEGNFTLRFFEPDSASAARDEPVVMKDVIRESGEYPGLLIREIEFSVRVAPELNSLTAWVCFDNGIEGFASYEQSDFEIIRNACENDMRSAFVDPAYDLWFKSHYAVSDIERAFQARQTFDIMPTYSIIVPLYNTPLDLFGEMVDSVLRQSYGRFELILVNSTPENAELACRIRDYAQQDERVKYVDLEENLGITENTNSGIAAARGDFLCFLDHDDLITPDALYWYTRAINERPDTDLLYSDEDKIQDGRYVNPYFKPDWNPDLLTSMNYVCHFLCVRKSIVDELEPPTRIYDGSQDHHLTLRVSERARNIYHVRRILYHWRIVTGSTAGGIGAKPYALEAGIRAVQAHIDRIGLAGTVGYCPRALDHYEVAYELTNRPLVSILIPNKDNIDMLDRCVRSIEDKSTYDNFEIVIIENNSTDPATFAYYDKLAKLSDRVRVIRFEGAFNFAAINNLGAREARGDYLMLLNNDTEVITPDWLERMLALCMRESTGAVGARLLFPDGTIQHAGVMSLPIGPQHIGRFSDGEFPGYACMYVVRQNLSAVTAACMMTSKEAYESVGGMDEQFAVAYNDIDFCYALRKAGLLIVYEPGVELYHYESISRGYDGEGDGSTRFASELGRVRQKWPQYFSQSDPYGNPHFDSGIGGAYYKGFR